MTNQEMLLIPMRRNDAGAPTVGGYLKALLAALWREEEGFSGKRPFGNVGWKNELHVPLIEAGVVRGGAMDRDGYVTREGDADAVVAGLIESLFADRPARTMARRLAVLALRAEADRLDRAEG